MASDASGQIGGLELSYAQALLELADEANQRAEVVDEAAQLEELTGSQDDLQRLIRARSLSTSDRSSIIENLFKGRVSDLTYRFLQIVNEKDRLDRLAYIFAAVRELEAKRKGVIEVEAYVARALTENQSETLAGNIGKALGKDVVLHQTEDPSLIGGLKLRFEDRVVDGSVATQLRQLKQQMVHAGRNQAREDAKTLIQETA